jgi:hypothetical protein
LPRLPPTGVNQSWQQCECMRYSADATVPVNARGNRKPAGASGTANEKAVAVVEGSDGSTQYA